MLEGLAFCYSHGKDAFQCAALWPKLFCYLGKKSTGVGIIFQDEDTLFSSMEGQDTEYLPCWPPLRESLSPDEKESQVTTGFWPVL